MTNNVKIIIDSSQWNRLLVALGKSPDKPNTPDKPDEKEVKIKQLELKVELLTKALDSLNRKFNDYMMDDRR